MSVDNEEKIVENTLDGSSSGSVKIASDVVATIAGLAASEVAGIAGMSGGVVGGIAEMLGRKNLTKGVKVEVAESSCVIDIFSIIEYGVSITEVAAKVQADIKNAVESMTGLICTAINVHIQGVSFPKAEAAPAEEE